MRLSGACFLCGTNIVLCGQKETIKLVGQILSSKVCYIKECLSNILFLAYSALEKSILLGVIIVSSNFYFPDNKGYKIWKGYKYTEIILSSFLFYWHMVLETLETYASYLVLQFVKEL